MALFAKIVNGFSKTYLNYLSSMYLFCSLGLDKKNISKRHSTINDITVNEVLLVFLLLTLNISHIFFYCFYCWLWTSSCELGRNLLNPFLTNFPMLQPLKATEKQGFSGVFRGITWEHRSVRINNIINIIIMC